MRPKFKSFELESEVHELFAHVEVQTFQQQQLLNRQQDYTHSLDQMQEQLEKLSRSL
jgi:hypothetical protein